MTHTLNFAPGKAAMLGVIPGMGAAYNQQYDKAVAHFGMFAALCIVADEGHGIFGLAAAAFYIFSILDAFRSAEKIAASGPVPGSSDDDGMNLPLWGGTLILLGLLFFLDNIGAIAMSRILRQGWPLLFVGTGVYLIFRYFIPSSSPGPGQPGRNAPPHSSAARSGPSPPPASPGSSAASVSATPEGE